MDEKLMKNVCYEYGALMGAIKTLGIPMLLDIFAIEKIFTTEEQLEIARLGMDSDNCKKALKKVKAELKDMFKEEEN
jgi:hypothetical protein